MGLHSNLGPIDPQFGPWPALAILEEFDRAAKEIAADPSRAAVWHPILSKYHPTLLSQAEHAIKWSKEIAKKALTEGMFKGAPDADARATEIIEFLSSQDLHHAHGRHVHRKELQDKGLKILELESDKKLQDAVLSVHHAMMNTLMNTNAVKIIENHGGSSLIRNVLPMMQAVQMGQVVPVPQAPSPQPGPAAQPQTASARHQKVIAAVTLAIVALIVVALCAIAIRLWTS